MSTVRAKMRVDNVVNEENQENVHVSLSAVTDGSKENESFSKYTPCANMQISINKETPAADFFEQGKEYYLDFSPAE